MPKTTILCYASIFALTLTACSHHAEKPSNNINVAENALDESGDHPFKLKKGHRTKKLGGKRPDPRSYDNLWDRLFDRFDLPEISHPDIDRELSWFINHPSYIDRVQYRAEPFLYSIVKQLEKHNMPGELALLPVIESAFQPHAVSPANAAGIWQFIPATGRRYGLKQSHSYDGRRDVYASTRAAIKYLKKLHNDFNGDWLLAIAGYNCGEGAVSRAIEKNIVRGLPTDFWSLDLPQETRSYVPRLLAVAKLFSEADQYGISLMSMPNQPLYKTVKMNNHVDLALAANAADMSLDRLLQLNPGFKRQHADVDGTYRLFIPAHKKIADFKKELARQIESHGDYVAYAATTFESTDARSAPPPVATGESSPAKPEFSRVAAAAATDLPATQTPLPEAYTSTSVDTPSVKQAEVGIPVEQPDQATPIDRAVAVPQSTSIDDGAASNPSTEDNPTSFSSDMSLQLAESVVPETPSASLAGEATSASGQVVFGGARRGSIEAPAAERAKRVKSESAIVQARNEPASFRGRKKNAHESADDRVVRQRSSDQNNFVKKSTYVIREGDTAYSIARRHGMDVEDLKKMNNLARANDIKWGQSMTVASREDSKKAPNARTAAGTKPQQSTRYTAHQGETLFSISRRFNVSVADLRKWNGIKEDKQFRAGMNIAVSGEKN